MTEKIIERKEQGTKLHVVVDMVPFRSDGANGGVVSALLELLKGLRKRNVKITVLASRSNFNSLKILDELEIRRINIEGGEPIPETSTEIAGEVVHLDSDPGATDIVTQSSEEIVLKQTSKPKINRRYLYYKTKSIFLAICPEFMYNWLKRNKERIRGALWHISHPINGIAKPIARLILPHGIIVAHKRRWEEKRRKARKNIDFLSVVGEPVDLLFCPFTAVCFVDPNVPVVSQLNDIQHKYFPYYFSDEELNARDKFYSDLVDTSPHILAISRYTMDSFSAMYNYPKEKMDVVYLATQNRLSGFSKTDSDKELEILGLKAGKFLYYPANFWPHKNHRSLYIAFRMFLEAHPDSDLDLVLTGFIPPEEKDPSEIASRMGMKDRVRSLGYVTDAQVAALMGGCRFLIYPSLFEGFGLPIPEAMQVGTTVVCSNVTSLPEVAGNCAFYFEPYDPRNICEAIEYVLTHPKEENEKRSLFSDQLKKFSETEYLDCMLDVFMKVSKKR